MQTFCDLQTRLHLFQLISQVIKPGRCNFLLLYYVIYAYFELYHFLQKYVRLSVSEMHDFCLHLSTTLGEHLVHKFIPPKLDNN